ncbi:MAG: type II toxin-antitoxin system PemK/MazF family toxin [Bacillota bacterium]
MSYTPAQGDIIWLNFTPQSGHEQAGKRPALVISNDFFNKQTGLAVVCPITSTQKNYPLHVKAEGCKKITGYIMVEQVRSVDYASRDARFIEKAPGGILAEVLARHAACF